MAYGIPTPNLMTLADPYYQMIRQVSTVDPYQFKDTVRTDFLKDAYVPAKQAGAAVEYLNNVYAARDRRNTMESDLARSAYSSEQDAMQAYDDKELYPVLRPYQDTTEYANAYDEMLSAEQQVQERRDQILRGEAERAYSGYMSTVIGSDPLDTAEKINDAVLADPLASGYLKEYAYNRLIEEATKAISMFAPGTPEYNRARDVLIRTYNFGSVTPVAPVSPRPSLGYGTAAVPVGPEYTLAPSVAVPAPTGGAAYAAPLGAPPPATVAPIGPGVWEP